MTKENAKNWYNHYKSKGMEKEAKEFLEKYPEFEDSKVEVPKEKTNSKK